MCLAIVNKPTYTFPVASTGLDRGMLKLSPSRDLQPGEVMLVLSTHYDTHFGTVCLVLHENEYCCVQLDAIEFKEPYVCPELTPWHKSAAFEALAAPWRKILWHPMNDL